MTHEDFLKEVERYKNQWEFLNRFANVPPFGSNKEFVATERQRQALQAIEAKRMNDPRFTTLIIRLSKRMNMNPDQVEQQIRLMSMI